MFMIVRKRRMKLKNLLQKLQTASKCYVFNSGDRKLSV
ncbi:hypothetical protein L917_20259 [Phytophthora nicotianae]|uniref:Uncharacterized protein n=1 Tax=Phytophthora nicotianae TaxID=4792 RepID=W2K1M1_PHYNI|nr:hypothetical protein L917_20259 [Phytophthora nicotianae]